MASVNLVLQGKGGVGKSFVASLLAQHYRKAGVETVCIDTDPVNATFTGYAAYDVRRLDILAGDDIDPRAFDELVELVMAAPSDAAVVVDNGAATFVPLCSYLLDNRVTGFLAESGHAVRFHSVVTGGPAQRDTLVGLDSLCTHFPEVPVVVWLNEYFGKTGENGKSFEDFPLYQANAARIHALVTLPAVRPETYGRDIEAMLKARLTFEEAIASPAFAVMAKQRLKTYRRDLDRGFEAARL